VMTMDFIRRGVEDRECVLVSGEVGSGSVWCGAVGIFVGYIIYNRDACYTSNESGMVTGSILHVAMSLRQALFEGGHDTHAIIHSLWFDTSSAVYIPYQHPSANNVTTLSLQMVLG
jgi:hypothetical protein